MITYINPLSLGSVCELILLAAVTSVVGRDHWTGRTALLRPISFVAFWGVVLLLAIASRDYVPRGQAFIRAATVPLCIAGISMALDRRFFESLLPGDIARVAVVSLPVIQGAYLVIGPSTVEFVLGGLFALLLVLTATPVAWSRMRRLTTIVLLALVASEFTFQYVAYPVHRIGVVPASALVLTLRCLAATAVLVGSTTVAMVARSLTARLPRQTATALALSVVGFVQVAYFYIDVFTDPTIRTIHVAAVAVSAIGVAAVSRLGTTRVVTFGDLTAAGLFGLVCLHFGFAYSVLS